MEYARLHDALIERARLRSLEGYTESHHIWPRCFGGDNAPSNIVELTPEEHYVVHQLLVKMYPWSSDLALSAMRMSRQCTGNKAFGWIRRRVAAARRGIRFSVEHRRKMADAKRGKPSVSRGKKRSFATKLLMRKLPPEQAHEIRLAVAAGAKRKEVMAKYGVSRKTVYTIVHREPWGDDPRPAA